MISVGLDMVQEDDKGRFVKGIIPWNKRKPHGYNCLVLWEDEFKDENAIVSKIKEFLSYEV